MTTSENDPTIEAERVSIPMDGRSVPAYVAAPRDAGPATPNIVLLMHLYGVDEDQRDVARRFAKNGFAVAIPDLYASFDAPSGDGCNDFATFVPFAQRLSFETVERDMRAAAAYLRGRFPESKTAVAGFCMGGLMTLRRTIGYGDLFSAAAVWYGKVPDDVDPADVSVPIVASYGGKDHSIPVESVEKFFAGVPVPTDVKIYPEAGHAFCDSTRAAYDPTAAEDSFTRTIAFLNVTLS